MPLDDDRCYAAVRSGDRRFDGVFIIAVRTTGIYCRPSCPAITPRRANVEFYRSAAAAQQMGYRACKRCLPDATPGSPEWDVRDDLVGRAMDLIADGVVDRDGVAGLAQRLGYSERHLTRVITDELGAGPIALARSQRAQTARTLIETTTMPMTDIAFAAGFGSVRQFNDTVRAVYASSPTDLRRQGRAGQKGDGSSIEVRLPTRSPYDADWMLSFLADRAVRGVEWAGNGEYARALDLPRGHGTVDVRCDREHAGLIAEFRLADWRDLQPAVRRLRRLFDLDTDSFAVDEHLANDATMRPLVDATPGTRAPGSVSTTETMVRAVIGQQISVAGARTVAARLVDAVGVPLAVEHPHLTHIFPTMAAIGGAPDDAFAMPTARRDALRRVAAATADGTVDVDADRSTLRRQLLDLRGIGPWTADYVLMRGRSDPDVMLPTDLGVRHALASLAIDPDDVAQLAHRWRPWSTYALHYFWRSLTTPQEINT